MEVSFPYNWEPNQSCKKPEPFCAQYLRTCYYDSSVLATTTYLATPVIPPYFFIPPLHDELVLFEFGAGPVNSGACSQKLNLNRPWTRQAETSLGGCLFPAISISFYLLIPYFSYHSGFGTGKLSFGVRDKFPLPTLSFRARCKGQTILNSFCD